MTDLGVGGAMGVVATDIGACLAVDRPRTKPWAVRALGRAQGATDSARSQA